jgi:alpha-tubulin suppressor-like RCC1 family protein
LVLVGVTVGSVVVACSSEIPDGYYSCDPAAENPCPQGYYCQKRGTHPEHRCYSNQGGVCGDGVLDRDQGEQCDGDDVDETHCSSGYVICNENCVATCTWCGNGEVESAFGIGEQCDATNLAGQTCRTLGYDSGQLRCSPQCQFDTAACSASCGDGIRNADEEEECDGRDFGDQTCATHGYWHGELHCSDACEVTTNACVGAISVGAAHFHTCAVDAHQQAFCWGINNSGQLGSGNISEAEDVPVAVTGDHEFVQIAVGDFHTCARTAAGRVYCWGYNGYGQLGNNTLLDRHTPFATAGDHEFLQVRAAANQTCGLDAEGRAWCWGRNSHGQVGASSLQSFHATPQLVAGQIVFSTLEVGSWVTCGVDVTERAWCWGRAVYGLLGDGQDEVDAFEPVAVDDSFLEAGVTVAEIAPGRRHNCLLDSEGRVWCWGCNQKGALGNDLAVETGDWGWTADATRVLGDHTFTQLYSGPDQTCAIDTFARTWCWGVVPTAAAPTGLQPRPYRVAETPFDTLAVGYAYGCGIGVQGKIQCWGFRGSGALGAGLGETDVPQALTFDLNLDTISLGLYHTIAVDDTHTGWGWGAGLTGQIGDHTFDANYGPVKVLQNTSSAGTFVPDEIAAGWYHSCALDTIGGVWCWGASQFGETGYRAESTEPWATPLDWALTATEITVGPLHTCVLAENGEAWCFGNNSDGRLGDGTHDATHIPVAVAGGHTFVQISAGGQHTCAVDTAGMGWCFGNNNVGQLGDGTLQNQTTAVAVRAHSLAGAHWETIVCGQDHTCALDSTGKAWCWGSNIWGGLGGAPVQLSPEPLPVYGERIYQSLATQGYHTCALDEDGKAWCWGHNMFGQLGDGTRELRYTPVPVDTSKTFVWIGVGVFHSCARDSGGIVWCWGNNITGQLGVEDFVYQPQPVASPSE